MCEEMIYADPDYKKKVLRITAFVVVFVLILAGLGFNNFQLYLKQMETVSAVRLITVLLVIIFAVPCLFSIWIIKVALHSLKEKRFPPTGTKVIRDTKVLYDDKARIRSVILIALALFIIELCVIAIVFLSRLLLLFI